MTTPTLFQYVRTNNRPVGPVLFVKLTDPGEGDPSITGLGFDIRQSIGGVDTYTYTAINEYRQPVTLAWLNVSGEEMTIQTGYNGRREIDAADLPGIVAGLITGRPELKHPARALAFANEELFVHVVDNDPDEIPFDGRPIPYDNEADDYAIEPAW